MSELVFFSGDRAVTSTLIIAEGTQNEHRAVLQLVRNYIDDLQQFGNIVFKMKDGKALPHGGRGRRTEYALLNAAQAAFILSRIRGIETSRLLGKFVKSLPNQYQDAIMQLIATIDVDDLPHDRFVYVAQEQYSKRFKISISKNPERRIRELNIGNPEPLLLVKVIKAHEPRYLSETAAHRALSDHHLNGEWFDSAAPIELLH